MGSCTSKFWNVYENQTQSVRVVNSLGISGSVQVEGKVNIGNTVDVNIHEINGYNEVTTGRGTHSVFPYGYMLPVDNW